ncbi:wax ester/triacylglycerol synthase domain-containing protein [Actinokineospora iranica]|uniref:diacylglycerol O-acyltransferase n=1 Tax=Actinokineospora iranica TaxID=1271860 RepID=A0A1G6VTM6_9PSEU|nr:wax ester/triacylglycerol synthase domain-containing protein [Actinokineospora iranica]SDD57040.1 Wax ester synthase-like Acyl-CoA acyltransferase domain-containing protein [Actinokineospora iranica]
MLPMLRKGRPTRGEDTSACGAPQGSIDRALLNLAHRTNDSGMHLGAVLLFDGEPPDTDALVTHVTERLPLLPELTLRAAGSARKPRWEPDPAFDIGHHIHQVSLPPGSGSSADNVINAMVGLPLDSRRPLWGLWLIRTDHGYALCYRAHHGFQDGQAATHTLRTLFAPSPPRFARSPARPPALRLGLAVVKDMLPLLRRTAHWSGVDQPPSLRRVAGTADVDLVRLQAIARATDSTLNQVCLTLVTSLLRAGFPGDWPDSDQTSRATMGVALGTRDTRYPRLGNRLGVAHITLPCGESSALRRLDLLHAQVTPEYLARIRQHHAVLFQRMPYWCGKLGVHVSAHPRFVPLLVAEIRGRAAMTFAGVTAHAAYALPALPPRQPLFIAWVVYRNRLHTTFLADEKLAGREQFPNLWQQAVDELEAQIAP